MVLFLVTTALVGIATFVRRRAVATRQSVTPAKISVSAAERLNHCRNYRFDHKKDYVLVSFTDYECPACRQLDHVTDSFVAKNQNRLNYSVLNFPLSQHKHARMLALYAIARGRQGISGKRIPP